MFMIARRDGLAEIERLEPEIAAAAMAAVAGARATSTSSASPPSRGARLRAISFDYAVMERTDRAAVLEAGDRLVGHRHVEGGLGRRRPKDETGNAALGDGRSFVDTSDSYVRSDAAHRRPDRHRGCGGRRDRRRGSGLADRARRRGQAARRRPRRRNRRSSATHAGATTGPGATTRSRRPRRAHQVKRIVVKPGERLSLQKHPHRAEHWVVVRGTAEVTRGDEVDAGPRERSRSTFRSARSTASANPGKIPLELIEVQFGSYLGEDDIVRFEDDYGRAKN